MNTHKRIALYLFFIMVVTACASVATPAPVASPTSTSIPTATLIPLTPTASPTVEPSPTPDPYKPVGTEGTDAQGLYIEVNGVKNRQIELVDPVTGEKITIWAGSLNAGEALIPLYDWSQEVNNNGWSDQLLFQLLVDPRVPGANDVSIINHPPQAEPTTGKTFFSIFFLMFARSRGVGSKDGLTYDASKPVVFKFETSAGSFEWDVATHGVQDITTIIRRVEDLPVQKDNGVHKYQDPYDSSNHFLVKMYSVNNKLYTEIASEAPLDKLSPEQLAFMALFGPISVIQGEDQVNSQYISDINTLANLAVDSAPVYFTFTPRP